MSNHILLFYVDVIIFPGTGSHAILPYFHGWYMVYYYMVDEFPAQFAKCHVDRRYNSFIPLTPTFDTTLEKLLNKHSN